MVDMFCSFRKSEAKVEREVKNLLQLNIQQALVVSMQTDAEATSKWALSVYLKAS